MQLPNQAYGTASAARAEMGNEGPFAIFALILALYFVGHHIYLFYGVGIGRAGLTLFVLPAAFALALWPRNLPLFVLAVALHVFETLMMLPIGSNHTIMSLFLMAGLAIAYGHAAWAGRSPVVELPRFYDTFAPLGRWLLIIMYFYGTLHKVNSDFLNPLTSCAVSLWRRYPFPEFISDSATVHTLTMYGTLAVEATAIAMLLTRRLRWCGIVIGVSFHGFLGFLPPGRIVAYSLLSIVLHSLFLPRDSLARFQAGAVGRRLSPLLATLPGRLLFGVGGLALAIGLPREASWTLFLALVLGYVIAYGREPETDGKARRPWLASPALGLNALALVFFLNGASPYLGFKTGQTISMFSNLVTEDGRSNHLFLPSIPLFDYQSRIVDDIETDQPALAQWHRQGYKMVEFQVLDYLERSPGASATFVVDGKTYHHSPAHPLPAVSQLPPRWLRNLMVFRPVVLKSPRPCDSY